MRIHFPKLMTSLILCALAALGFGLYFFIGSGQKIDDNSAPIPDSWRKGIFASNAYYDGTYVSCNHADDCDSFVIKTDSDNKTSISGDAQWVGSLEGQVNVGRIDGILIINGSDGYYEDDSCTIHFVFRNNGSVDVAEGERSICGGLNVSFTGTYHRK